MEGHRAAPLGNEQHLKYTRGRARQQELSAKCRANLHFRLKGRFNRLLGVCCDGASSGQAYGQQSPP